MTPGTDRVVTAGAVVLLVVLGFLPLTNWIAGGPEAAWYGPVIADWLAGGSIAVGGGLVLAILARRLPLWRNGLLTPLLERYDRTPTPWIIGVAAVSVVVYGVVALKVLGGRPLLIDEIVQVFQGRIFAEGRLWREAFAYPEFFSSMHVIDAAGRVYGQYPAGGPLMFMLGYLVGAEWLVVPLSGALSVVVFAFLVRRIDLSPGVRLGATCLYGLAPFTVFLAGSHMNHVTVMLWILVGILGLATAVTAHKATPWWALVSGLGFGIAATIRPVDALAFALPAGLWYLWRSARLPGRWKELVASGVGVALPAAALLWINAQTTGHPLRFGYTVLYGEAHNLGFHSAPWGAIHTPARGLELINLYFLRLQTYLFETPFPSLVPVILALALSRRLTSLDRYLLVGAATIVGLYFAYWHDGFYLGPRFMYPLLPLLVVWTARLPRLVRERFGGGLPYRATIYAYLIGGVIAISVSAPLRARIYAAGMLSPRWDANRAAAAAGVGNALVLVRESWGAQLMARMWAVGVSRPNAELFYRSIDRCELEQAVTELEATGTKGNRATEVLMPLVADSGRLIQAPFSVDPTARVLPGSFYTPVCRRRVAEEQAGFGLFPPTLLADQGGNLYARDLHARDSLLLALFPDREVYLLKPPSTQEGQEPKFYRVSRDSLRRAWASPPAP